MPIQCLSNAYPAVRSPTSPGRQLDRDYSMDTALDVQTFGSRGG